MIIVAMGSVASFASFANSDLEKVQMSVCQKNIDITVYESVDANINESVVITRGVVCQNEEEQCPQQQQAQQRRYDSPKREIAIKKESVIFPGEAKIYKNKLFLCRE